MTRQTRGDPGKNWTLEVNGIAKNYGATCALRNASLRLRPGKVHALLGENGAGKSTLVKIVVGAIQPDRGRIALNGIPTRFSGVRQAIAAGVIPIYQHLSLFPHLSVLENLSAFAIAGAAGLRARPALVPRATARVWLDAVGFGCNLDLPVERLSVGERHLVEIARGLGQALHPAGAGRADRRPDP
ncbi:ATP-binding cassette domain-containing protein [Azospirillum sp. B506]|uniref:ATP-binding cassette domain-containing protein n=1 Tax=Azospirillum sp. B506 TaxID=137721 RepID=UPI0003456A24|nr:ATP-binding cassette domain-containing protein [Azospirillum sp. B506]